MVDRRRPLSAEPVGRRRHRVRRRLDPARSRRRALPRRVRRPTAPIDLDEAIAQAETERDAGALLLRDAGSPIDTRSLDDRDDLPRIIRAGSAPRPAEAVPPRARRSNSRTSRSCRTRWPSRPAGATAGSSWSATGSTAPSAIWRRCGPTTCSGRDRRRARRRRPGHRARVRRGRAARADQRRHRLHRARHRADRRHHRADGRARHRAGADADQHRELPRHRRRARRSTRPTPRTCATCYATCSPRIGAAREAGVPIYAGTDAGGMIAHGRIADEVDALKGIGMSPTEALGAACWDARAVAGPTRARARRSGRSRLLRRRPALGRRRAQPIRTLVILRGRVF